MLDMLLDSMEDERISEAMTELAATIKRRIVDGEKRLAWSKGEDCGSYNPDDYRDCLTRLSRLVEALSTALVNLDSDLDIDEMTEGMDKEVEAMKQRIAEKLAKKAAAKASIGAGV